MSDSEADKKKKKKRGEDSDEEEKKLALKVNSYTDIQRFKLEKLMKDPSKPAFIPERRSEKNVNVAPEFNHNIMGSSAGAGSGEFHLYRQMRRKEQNRMKVLGMRQERDELNEAYHAKLEENAKQAEDKTAKKRKKRQKKKERQKMKKKEGKDKKADKSDDESASEEESDEDEPDPKEAAPPGDKETVPPGGKEAAPPGDKDQPTSPTSQHKSTILPPAKSDVNSSVESKEKKGLTLVFYQ